MPSLGGRYVLARLFITLLSIGFVPVSFPVQAQSVRRTPLPEFTGDRVIVSEVPNQYQKVAEAVPAVEKATGAFYYLAVVRSSGMGQDATRKYVDDLFQSWTKQPGGKSGRFDPERSVVIVVALDNQQIGTHAGAWVRERYGLDAATIRSEIVGPRFIQHAKNGDFNQAMLSLLEGFQEKISTVRGKESPAAKVSSSNSFLWALLASVAAILGIILGLLWLGRRRVSGSVSTRLKGVKGQAVEAMDRLDALKERLKLLPATAGFDQPMTGETLTLRDAVQARLDSLWDRWLHVMDKIEKAQKLLQNGSGFGLGNRDSRQAEEIIKKEIQFPEIDAEAKLCEADLDRLEKAHGETKASLESFTEARGKLKGQIDEVSKAGLPTEPFVKQVDAIQGLASQADSLQVADPIGAASIVAKGTSQVEDQIHRARLILSLSGQSKTIERSIKEIQGATAGQRTRGLRLDEEGGNPDVPLAESKKQLDQGIAALNAGEPESAQPLLDQADKQAKLAQQTLDSVIQAKAACRRESSARERETAKLRDALSEARNYRDELQRDFAPSSWDGVARNLDQAKALIDTFDRKAAEAAEQATETRQDYLQGARLYEDLARQQQIALRLMAGLGEQLNTLSLIRKECQDLVRQLESTDRSLESLFQKNQDVLSDATRSDFDAARSSIAESQAKSQERRPDWPAIREQLSRAQAEFKNVETLAQADISAYQAMVSELERAERDADQVGSFLRQHTEDRPAANQRYQSATRSLSQIRAGRVRARDWSHLLQLVRDAAADLQAAERMAKEDIRLAAQAESDINEADAMIRQAGSGFGFGIQADASNAMMRLQQAQQQLQSQNYEQAISQAEAAYQSARSAYNMATQQASFQRMQYEAEERRRYASDMARSAYRGPSAGSVAAATAAATILNRMGEGAGWTGGQVSAGDDFQDSAGHSSGVETETSSNENSDDSTSVSSWSSDSTQSEW